VVVALRTGKILTHNSPIFTYVKILPQKHIYTFFYVLYQQAASASRLPDIDIEVLQRESELQSQCRSYEDELTKKEIKLQQLQDLNAEVSSPSPLP